MNLSKYRRIYGWICDGYVGKKMERERQKDT
jgi:hypothetical protein